MDCFGIKENKGRHPLLFPPVLNKIFGYISLWNQKKCRLVCKTWEQEVGPFLRLNCKVNLSKLVQSIESEEALNLNIHGQSIIENLSKICTSYIVEDEDPTIIRILSLPSLLLHVKYLELRNLKWNLSQVQDFILKELPSLEEVRLPIQCAVPLTNPTNTFNNNNNNSCSSTNNKCISDSMQLLSKFPNLKVIIVTLTIRDLQYYDHRNTSIEPLLKLIESTPNLEEIYYPNIVQFTSPFDNPARILLENIVYNPSASLHKLSTLKIDTFLCNQDLEILSVKGLPLKSVQITLIPDISCKNLYAFLIGIENTLKSLTLTFRDGFRLTSRFPILANLDRMSVILWKGYLDYIQEISQVKTLIFVLMEMEVEMIENKTADFCSKSRVEELDIHAVRNAKSDIVQKMIKLSSTPYLKRLTMDCVNDTQLQTIYLTLPYIEELVILYGGFTETGITGIPRTFCREEYCDKEFYVLGLKKYPGIGDLRCLRSLVLTGDLNDFIIMLGIGQCRKLKRLELIARQSSKISDRSVKKIADSMDLDLLRLRNFTEISELGIAYLKTKLLGREIYIN